MLFLFQDGIFTNYEIPNNKFLKNRRGLTSIVGTVFFVIVASTIIGYIAYSMNLIDNFAQSIETKQHLDYERTTEKFKVVKVNTVNNKFNFTLQNNGNIPIKVSRLWVDNTTDSTWPESKFDLNTKIAPGATETNIGQNLNLIALNTQSYFMKFVTERGNSERFFINSVGNEPLYLQLSAMPESIPIGYKTTFVLEVVNTGPNKLLNLQPEIDSEATPICTGCSFQRMSGPTPASYPSLEPGDIAIFKWVYKFTGTDGDQLTINASLVNGLDQVSATTTLTSIELASQAGSAITAVGLGKNSLPDNILLFHGETFQTPSGKYQMYPGIADGGVNGLLIQLDQTTPSFFTKNGTEDITVPAGVWKASLQLQSEAMPTNLKGDGEDMIFHFEDGDGVDPDNSEGSSTRDLEGCGQDTWGPTPIPSSTDDAEQNVASPFALDRTSSDLEMPYDGSVLQISGMRWTNVNVPKNSNIISATIRFTADQSESGTTNLRFYGQAADNPGTFSGNGDLNAGSRPRTTANFAWSNVPSWTNGQFYTTPTPGITPIIQEIVNRAGWVEGNSLVIIVEDNGSTASQRRRAHAFDQSQGQSAHLTITFGGAGGTDGQPPDWQAGSGPHLSGSYYFDGINDCFRSKNAVSNADGNHINTEPDTTALWFKTDGTVSSEQHLVYWDGSNGYYRISITNTGKVLFRFNSGGTDTTSCQSTLSYDNSSWYHVTAVREGTGSADQCTLYIHDINGARTESPISQDNNYASNNVVTTGQWIVAGDKNGNGNFKGWIDDIIHWNDKALTAAEADAIGRTNYGTGAHKISFKLDKTDQNGSYLSNLFTQTQSAPFVDPKEFGDNSDSYYKVSNHTFNLPQVNVTTGQRLNFTISFVGSTSSWEALELDFKIDDQDIIPISSFLETPMPDNPFPSYFIYDNDNEAEFWFTNAGPNGFYLTQSGTRITFNNTSTTPAYAGLIHRVNGTTSSFDVTSSQDSIYIPNGSKAYIVFYRPTDKPCTTPTSCGTIIPPGTYQVNVWVSAYDDQGSTFSKTFKLGNVVVQE